MIIIYSKFFLGNRLEQNLPTKKPINIKFTGFLLFNLDPPELPDEIVGINFSPMCE